MDRKILWLLLIVCVAILLYYLIDHVLFPTLPMPAGASSITR